MINIFMLINTTAKLKEKSSPAGYLGYWLSRKMLKEKRRVAKKQINYYAFAFKQLGHSASKVLNNITNGKQQIQFFDLPFKSLIKKQKNALKILHNADR